jgi:tetratricopeptide (TPR) repeat protein
VVLGVFGYITIDLLPSWFHELKGPDARALGRGAAIAFLDGLLIAYAPALVGALAGTVVLAYRRSRGRIALPLARLLSLSVSVLLGAVILEAGAAGWRAWLHRDPELPGTVARANTSDARAGAGPGAVSGAGPRLPDRFPATPGETSGPVNALKILVIGESSARGEPYHPWLSVGQIVAWRLKQVFPGRSIQVDIWATGGATLETMHNKLAGLTYRPDALFLYVGHNEFQARYAWMRDVDYYADVDRPPRGPLFPVVASFAAISPLCRLIQETREQRRLDMLPPRTVTRELIDRPVCTAAEAAELVADFERRLEAIAGYCETIAAVPIFVIPPSNDAGFDPSRSVLAPETTKPQRTAFARAVARARALEKKDRAQAIAIDRELVRSHPEFAEAHYRLALLLEQTGRWDEAQAHYAAARETDAMPLRCPEPFRQVYREVSARHPAVMLVDGPAVLAAQSPHGIVDDRFFHDAQHPNLRGYAALAEEVLNQMCARRAFGWPMAAEVPVVDIEACVRHFQIDATRWEKICSRGSAFFRATAYIRYDPRFRNERSAAYERSAAAIRSGVAPADAAIPGWPLPPRPATSRVIPVRQRFDHW